MKRNALDMVTCGIQHNDPISFMFPLLSLNMLMRIIEAKSLTFYPSLPPP